MTELNINVTNNFLHTELLRIGLDSNYKISDIQVIANALNTELKAAKNNISKKIIEYLKLLLSDIYFKSIINKKQFFDNITKLISIRPIKQELVNGNYATFKTRFTQLDQDFNNSRSSKILN